MIVIGNIIIMKVVKILVLFLIVWFVVCELILISLMNSG